MSSESILPSGSRLNKDNIPSTRLSLVELDQTNDTGMVDKHFVLANDGQDQDSVVESV